MIISSNRKLQIKWFARELINALHAKKIYNKRPNGLTISAATVTWVPDMGTLVHIIKICLRVP